AGTGTTSRIPGRAHPGPSTLLSASQTSRRTGRHLRRGSAVDPSAVINIMGRPGIPVNETRPSRDPRSRLVGPSEPLVERQVVVELAFGRVEAAELVLPGVAERTAETWLVDETPRARLELLLRPEQEAGDAVLDERAVALDVGGEDGPADRHRLEHGVGHAALGRGR